MRILVIACLLFAAQQPQSRLSPQARNYIDEALHFMQENFAHRDKIDWDGLRRDTFAHASGATASDMYDAIRFALTQLGDGHSFLQTPSPAASSSNNKVLSPFANRRTTDPKIFGEAPHLVGQVAIPSFSGQDAGAFAARVQTAIGELAAKHPCGWAVDLRGNGGGNMWPMLAGVGPILGEGEVGAFLDSSGAKTRWFYERGAAGSRSSQRETVSAQTSAPVVELPNATPVAVLIDGGTGSSGEAIAIAFRGRADTRFFGEKTYGVAQATFPYKLSDGAQLFLVVAVDLDRNGVEYPNGIQPDQATSSESALDAGMEWLLQQQACR